jgi:hypothetical protein
MPDFKPYLCLFPTRILQYPPHKSVIHSVIHIFGFKLVDKGVVRDSSVQVHLFHQRLLAIG